MDLIYRAVYIAVRVGARVNVCVEVCVSAQLTFANGREVGVSAQLGGCVSREQD